MHFRTHVAEKDRGISGQDEYSDGMVLHDRHVGRLLQKLDDLGITDKTIVFYSTDNGPHQNTWPDAGTTPFRSEKNTNWEGAWRVPAMVRWPGHIKPGSVSNDIMHHMDWLPTFLAAAGAPDVKEKLLNGYDAGGTTYKVHLDGYNALPYLTGQEDKGPRKEVFYFSDDGDLMCLRYQDWKIVFMEQRVNGTLEIWANPFTPLRVPKIFNLRRDPYERADVTSNTYYDWMLSRAYALVPAQAYVGKFLETFKSFPPRQKPASFSVGGADGSPREVVVEASRRYRLERLAPANSASASRRQCPLWVISGHCKARRELRLVPKAEIDLCRMAVRLIGEQPFLQPPWGRASNREIEPQVSFRSTPCLTGHSHRPSKSRFSCL